MHILSDLLVFRDTSPSLLLGLRVYEKDLEILSRRLEWRGICGIFDEEVMRMTLANPLLKGSFKRFRIDRLACFDHSRDKIRPLHRDMISARRSFPDSLDLPVHTF